MNYFRHARTFASSGSLLAALAIGACGGIVEGPSSGSSGGSSSGGVSSSGGASSSGGSSSGSSGVLPVKPIAQQPTGPYTGVVGTTDVSILYPMPLAGSSTAFVRPSDVGNHGALLPEATFGTILPTKDLDHAGGIERAGYGNVALVSLRLDACSARLIAGKCASEVRLVFQAVGPQLPPASADIEALDGAIHVVYDMPQTELVTMMREILTLKKANGDLALQELGPHPILTAQGLGGAFAQGLRNILLFHVGEQRIVRATSFDHNFMFDGDGWTFNQFERSGAGLVPRSIPTTNTSSQHVLGTSATMAPLESSSAVVMGDGAQLLDNVMPLVDASRVNNAVAAEAMESALRVESPTVHHSEGTTCANCHLAEGAHRAGALLGLSDARAFSHARSLARVDQRTSVTNLHAFGYLGRQISIMQRTANESVLVAEQMEALVAKP